MVFLLFILLYEHFFYPFADVRQTNIILLLLIFANLRASYKLITK